MKNLYTIINLLICCCTLFFHVSMAADSLSLKGKIICIDPGHGGSAATDHYRVGINGEREEWINLRVGLLLRNMLEKRGATVVMTRISDEFIDLTQRAKTAVQQKADVFLSIHHNATADRSVNFPIIYYHGAASENLAGVQLGKELAASFKKDFYKRNTQVSLVSDHTIFPDSGAGVLRNTYGIPGLLAEASFFSNTGEELRLKQDDHNTDEATAYLHALEAFLSKTSLPVNPKTIPRTLPPFKVFQEADRMKPEAREWLNDFNKAKKLQGGKDTADLRQAYDLFTRSARSFPDSYVARQCHEYRAHLLKKIKQDQEAAQQKTRAAEFYVKLD